MTILKVKDINGNWVDIPAIVGPQGPQGPQGPKGDDATYTLPTASADTLGGVKVGNGLVMDGDALGVVPDGKWELIESFTVEKDGYVIIKRTSAPDGTPYNLNAARIISNYKYPVVQAYYTAARFFDNINAKDAMVHIGVNINKVDGDTNRVSTALYQCKPVSGLYEPFGATGSQGTPMTVTFPAGGNTMNSTTENKIKRIDIQMYNGGSFPAGTYFEIWGVRA